MLDTIMRSEEFIIHHINEFGINTTEYLAILISRFLSILENENDLYPFPTIIAYMAVSVFATMYAFKYPSIPSLKTKRNRIFNTAIKKYVEHFLSSNKSIVLSRANRTNKADLLPKKRHRNKQTRHIQKSYQKNDILENQ